MTRLQLCQFVHRIIAAGNALPGTSPTTTIAQTGLEFEIVSWVDDAYRDILIDQDSWLFMTKKGLFNITSAQFVYTLANITAQIPDYGALKVFYTNNACRYNLIYTTATGLSTETYLYFVDWQMFRGNLDRGAVQQAGPFFMTEAPDHSLQFNTLPAVSQTVVLDYTVSPSSTVMTLDADVPILPDQYHKAIGWLAVKYWALGRESEAKYALATKEYNRIMNQMRSTELPPWQFNGTRLYGEW